MCDARGLRGRLGAVKRRILSLAEAPPAVPFVPLAMGTEVAAPGVPLVTGAADGMATA